MVFALALPHFWEGCLAVVTEMGIVFSRAVMMCLRLCVCLCCLACCLCADPMATAACVRTLWPLLLVCGPYGRCCLCADPMAAAACVRTLWPLLLVCGPYGRCCLRADPMAAVACMCWLMPMCACLRYLWPRLHFYLHVYSAYSSPCFLLTPSLSLPVFRCS